LTSKMTCKTLKNGYSKSGTSTMNTSGTYMSCDLSRVRTGLQGAIYPIRGRVIVGRRPDQALEPDCTVITVSDICLARRHAEFALKDDGYVHVTDLRSPNGTLVNGRCISSTVLHDGDEIRLGRSLFLYRHFPGETDQ
jgi:pSer/pThr/pTyr-binding forkhead associated (FHA) protein